MQHRKTNKRNSIQRRTLPFPGSKNNADKWAIRGQWFRSKNRKICLRALFFGPPTLAPNLWQSCEKWRRRRHAIRKVGHAGETAQGGLPWFQLTAPSVLIRALPENRSCIEPEPDLQPRTSSSRRHRDNHGNRPADAAWRNKGLSLRARVWMCVCVCVCACVWVCVCVCRCSAGGRTECRVTVKEPRLLIAPQSRPLLHQLAVSLDHRDAVARPTGSERFSLGPNLS